MKALIAALILILGLGCVSLESRSDKQARMETFAWLEMCQLLEDEADYQCMRLMPPLVVYERMHWSLDGYYDGSDTIHVNQILRGTNLTDTLMHEAIHYVHVQMQIIPIPGPPELVCASEDEAFTLTGLYWNEDNSNWWKDYPHCWEWYADDKNVRAVGQSYNTIIEIIDIIILEN